MNYNDYLNGVIDGGIEGAKRSYSNPNNSNHPMMLEGAIAGFEACRGKSPEELGVLLGEAGKNTTRAMLEDLPDYWRHRCFHAEIEWVCNCVSATQSAVSSTQLVRRLVENHPQLSPRERHNINRALDAGAAYGYGNVISWLMTEWAVNLRDKWGMDEQTAIRATQMSPYPLPPNEKLKNSGPVTPRIS